MVNFCMVNLYFLAAFSTADPARCISCRMPRSVPQPFENSVVSRTWVLNMAEVSFFINKAGEGLNKPAHVDEMPVQRRSGSHGGADQMGAPAGTLAAFKVAVAC